MDDIRGVFDAFLSFDSERQKQRRIADLESQMRAVGKRCGDCQKWMKSRECPSERNVSGYTRGPSSGGYPCGQFVESPSATKWRDTLKAKLSDERKTP